MNNEAFKKNMDNLRKHRDIKIVTKNKKLFGVRTNISYYQVFHGEFISNRNEKKWNNY